jgi:enoyl-CoA hydratase
MPDPVSTIEISTPAAHVRLIRLNRPGALNALSIALLSELAAALDRAAADDEVRAVVLTGDERAFSAGADIKEMPEGGIPMWGQADRLRAWKTIERFGKPVIAAVDGYALGGGCELAIMSDIVIAGEGARFGFPEVKIAAFAGDGGTQRAPRLIGRSRALMMMMTGDWIDAEKAERWGLATEVVPAGRTVARAIEIASRIAEMSPIAVRMIKEEVAMADHMPLDESLSLERKLLLWQTRDHDEGIRAFVEKRKPRFTGS